MNQQLLWLPGVPVWIQPLLTSLMNQGCGWDGAAGDALRMRDRDIGELSLNEAAVPTVLLWRQAWGTAGHFELCAGALQPN